MITFKNYWRLVKHYRLEIILPLIIFVGFSFLSKAQAQTNQKEYTSVIPSVAIINHDQTIGTGLLEFLDGKVELVELREDQLEEALFYHQVSLILVIPEDFTTQFEAGNQQLYPQILPSSANAYIAESLIDEYLGYYVTLDHAGYTHETIQTMIMSAKAQAPEVVILDDEGVSGDYVMKTFANMSIYPIFITVLSVLPPVLMAFNQAKIRRRLMVSSTPSLQKNAALFVGTFVVGHVLWGLMMGLTYFLMRDSIRFEDLGLQLLNSYCFFLMATSFASFVSQIIQTPNALSAITNSVGLGLSFISGVFVPREYLGAAILNFAKLFPFYWNIEINEMIYQQTATWSTMAGPLAIQLLYAVIFLLLALVVSRNRKLA